MAHLQKLHVSLGGEIYLPAFTTFSYGDEVFLAMGRSLSGAGHWLVQQLLMQTGPDFADEMVTQAREAQARKYGIAISA